MQKKDVYKRQVVEGVFSINYDITYLVMAENALHSFTGNVESKKDVAKSTSNAVSYTHLIL